MKQNIHSVLTREFLDVLDCKIQCGWLIVGESAIQRYLARIQIERKCKGDLLDGRNHEVRDRSPGIPWWLTVQYAPLAFRRERRAVTRAQEGIARGP